MSPPRARASGWLIAVLILAASYWTFDLAVLGAGVPHPLDDHWEETIIARHLIAGDGFRTSMIYPPLWGFRDSRTLTLPVLVHGPVVPLLMVPPLLLFGARSLDHVAWGAALFAILTLVPLYRVASRHFGPFIAAMAALLFTVAPYTLQGVHHSFSVIFGAFLLVTVLDLLARERPHAAGAGLVAGLAYLVRPEMLLGAVIYALYATHRAGWRGLARFAAGFVLLPLPWWAHHFVVTGSPLFNVSSYNLVGSWGDHPGLSVLRDFDLTPDRFPEVLRAALPQLWRKWVVFFAHGAKHALFSPSGATGWLALAGIGAVLAAPRRASSTPGELVAWLGLPPETGADPRAIRALVIVSVALAMIPVLSSTIAVYQVLYMVPFMPLYALGAALGARFLAGRLRVPRLWWVALAVLMAPSVVMALRAGHLEAGTLRASLAAERAGLSGLAIADSTRLVFSDTPDFVAWTTGVPTVWVTRGEFDALYGADGARARGAWACPHAARSPPGSTTIRGIPAGAGARTLHTGHEGTRSGQGPRVAHDPLARYAGRSAGPPIGPAHGAFRLEDAGPISIMKTVMHEPIKDQHADLFRDVCENAHDLIQSVTPDGRFLYVNRAWLETLGYRRNEVAKLHVFDIVHADSREHCQQVFTQLLKGKDPVRIETTFVTKDGHKVEVEGSVGCRFEKGRAVSTRGIFRDVTESQRARREFDRLFQLSLDMMCVASTDGYFKHVNPAFERVLGYTEEELLSGSFLDYVHPDDRDATVAAVERLAQGLPIVDFENRYRAKDGTYRWIEWRSAPVAEDGLIYAVASDVTERKRIEALMVQQADDLARSNADLEMFAYAASHDLRAPLRAISNLSEWIGEDLGDEVPEKVSQHLDKLHDRVRRMERLIDDLLKYSRAGRRSGESEKVDCGALIHEMTVLIAPPEGFEVVADAGLPTFETIKSPLEQVFRNLIENGIKHHDGDKGRIVVSVRKQNGLFEFAVADDGPGIPPESRDKVFEAFERLPSERRSVGSGLGLALVRRIVQTFGGRIWVEPAEPRGTVFRFTWPKRIGG